MTLYALTLHFDAEPESMTMFEDMTGEQAIAYFPITKKQMRQKGIKITSFNVTILQADGRPKVIPAGEIVAEYMIGRSVKVRRVQ